MRNFIPQPAVVIAIGGLAAILWLAVEASSPAQAPPQERSAFQISAFGYPSSAVNPETMYGAYIIDSESGKVWICLKNHEPRLVGSIEN